MEDKTIYNYDSRTGQFLGSSYADESPLEPGVFHIPAYATDVPPHTPTEGAVSCWVGDKWELVDISTLVLEHPDDTGDNLPSAMEVMAKQITELQSALIEAQNTINMVLGL